jgi:CheY-like chemotaxis protein
MWASPFIRRQSSEGLPPVVTPVIPGPGTCKLPAICPRWNAQVSEAPKEILVVEDDAIMRELVVDWLEGAGYRVRAVADCSAATQEAGRGAPALVISDMWMPGPCGGDAITRLKKRFPQVQLIAISGHFNSGQGFSAEAALKSGAERALAKPVERRELIRAVAELLGPATR